MSTPVEKPQRRWPLGVKLLIVLTALILIPAGIIHLLGRASDVRWQRYAARLRAGGDPLTFEEIEAKRTRIPDDRNSALVLEKLFDELTELSEIRPTSSVFVFASRSSDADFFTGIDRDSIEASREFVEQHRGLLDKLSSLRDLPGGRFDAELDPEVGNVFRVLLPYMTHVRTAGKLARLDGMLRLIDGDLHGAADAARLQLAIGATLNEHIVIGRLVQMAVGALALRTVEDALRVGELDDAALQELIDVFQLNIGANSIKWALLGERAFFIEACEDIIAGRLTPSDITSPSGGVGGLHFLPNVLIRNNQMRGAEMYTRMIEAADDPVALNEAARRVDREASKLPWTQLIVKMLLPSLTHAVMLDTRLQAEMRCTVIGLAAERYRLASGRLPSSLDELVPRYLDAVLPDPFDAQPMRFATTDQGIVIYSIGDDLVDDGGIVVRQPKRPYILDVGFRLLKPEHRGLLLVDAPQEDAP